MKVYVVDTETCNLGSLRRALREAGAEIIADGRTDQPGDVEATEALVLPGVGSFPRAMETLGLKGQVAHILDCAARGIPILGICLGMQLLATTGTEGDVETEGLDLIPGCVEHLVPQTGERIPHVGWNEVLIDKPSPLLEGSPSGTDVYFTHSYALTPRDDADAIAFTPYAGGFTSVVQRGRVFGVQFHPEKSSAAGLRLLRNFVERGS